MLGWQVLAAQPAGDKEGKPGSGRSRRRNPRGARPGKTTCLLLVFER
jgi:hypothetical protein